MLITFENGVYHGRFTLKGGSSIVFSGNTRLEVIRKVLDLFRAQFKYGKKR